MHDFSLLVIEDDIDMAALLCELAETQGFSAIHRQTVHQGLEQLSAFNPDIVFTDLRLPDGNGIEVVEAVKNANSEIEVVMITGYASLQDAVEAFKFGLFDLVSKPFEMEVVKNLLHRLYRLLKHRLHMRQIETRLNQLESKPKLPVVKSPIMQQVMQQIEQVAPLDVSILIHGETGAGKEAVARSLHECSARAEKPFVAINCGALTHELVESELFGHRKGAFTGALESRQGKLELASGGTLFLDEVESMPLTVQIKLLRAIQEQQIERIGSNELIELDLIIISATKIDLLKLSEQGQFREDLYYRLAVAELFIPPLRERQEDILLLFNHFVEQAAQVHDLDIETPSNSYREKLLKNPWRGNVRELRNQATRFALGLESQHDECFENTTSHDLSSHSLATQMEEFERTLIRQSLLRHQGNIQKVLDELQLPRRTLNQKMLRLGLQRESLLQEETD